MSQFFFKDLLFLIV